MIVESTSENQTLANLPVMIKDASGSVLLSQATLTWLKVVEAYQLCDKMLSSRLAEIDVSVAEHEVMIVLLRQPGATQQHIARGCFVAKSGVSMLLARLESLGLIRRDSDPLDARVKRAFLTISGERLARKSLEIQQDIVALMAEPLSITDLMTVTSSMERVSNALRSNVSGY
jgi:DNA-binding MarR family transcriptional regulator